MRYKCVHNTLMLAPTIYSTRPMPEQSALWQFTRLFLSVRVESGHARLVIQNIQKEEGLKEKIKAELRRYGKARRTKESITKSNKESITKFALHSSTGASILLHGQH